MMEDDLNDVSDMRGAKLLRENQMTKTDLTVANIIWQQISLSTKMACGVRNTVGDEKSLGFTVTIKSNQCHKVVVTLDPCDTYTVALFRIKGTSAVVVEEHEDVYNDMLSEVIYRMCNK